MEVLFTPGETEKALVLQKLTGFLTGYDEIVFAYIFGSFVHDPGFHDLDIGVYLAGDAHDALCKETAFDYELQMGADLEKFISYPVDIKVLNRAPVPLCYAATQGEVLMSRDEPARYAWVEKTWDFYLDMKYFLRTSLFDLLSVETEPFSKTMRL